MRVVNLDLNAPKRRITALSYGASRSGKTQFAGSWPRPLFLSDNSEGGWETLRNMDPNLYFEEGVAPKVWSMESPEDMGVSLKAIDKLCRGEVITMGGITYKPGDVQTVVIDSLTFYADSYLNALEKAQGGKGDMRQVYQKLNQHLRDVMVAVHGLPVNVIWICLEKAPDEDNPATGGVLLAGQTRDKAPARCDYWFYHRSFTKNPTVGPEFEIRTKKFGPWPAGGRDGGMLPDPLPEATSRAVADALSIPVDGAGKYSAEEMAEKKAAQTAAQQENRATAAPANGGPASVGPPRRVVPTMPGRTTPR